MSDMAKDLLQSDGWEQFQRALGRRTHRVDGVLAIEMPLPLGDVYLYAPRSEELRIMNHESWGRIHATAKKIGAVFLRSEGEVDRPIIHDSSFMIPRVLRHSLEPEWTWRTSLVGSDDERLAAMHPKHRYNIRVAERHGVIVRVSAPPPTPPLQEGEGQSRSPTSYRGGARGGAMPEDLDTFWSLLQDTAKRQGIATHPRSYYETMLRGLPQTMLYLAECEGAPVATSIVTYYGDTATYLHGGSSHEHRNLMAPHLLHWQAMRDAKAAGMRWYDWGGINPEIPDSRFQIPDSRWSGITRFKQGFGGEAVHYPPTRDLVFRPNWYRLLSWMAKVRP